MGRSSKPPSVIHIPPPPPKEELVDFIDEISGAENVWEMRGGKKVRVQRRLPRSPEQQRVFDEANTLIERSLGELKKLYNYDPSSIVDFSPYVNTIAAVNKERAQDIQQLTNGLDFSNFVQEFKRVELGVLDDEYKRIFNQTEADLAANGNLYSSAGQDHLAALKVQYAKAREQVGVNAQMAGRTALREELVNRGGAYDLRERERQARLMGAEAEYGLERQKQEDITQKYQRAIENQGQLLNVASGITGEDWRKAAMTKAPELANQIFQQNSMDSINRYNASVNAANLNYQNQLTQYKMTPPTFGQLATKFGTNLAAQKLFGKDFYDSSQNKSSSSFG